MPTTNKPNQTGEIQKKQITAEKPDLPKEGLLASEEIKKTVAEENTKIRKWRRIVLSAITQQSHAPKNIDLAKDQAKQDPNIIHNSNPEIKEKLNENLQPSQKKLKPEIKNHLIQPEKIVASKSLSLKLFKTAVYIILIIILFATGLGFGFYNLGWQGKTIDKITQIMPYPAILIKTPCGYKNISCADFQFDLDAISYFYKQKKLNDENFTIPDSKQIASDVSDKKIKNKLMECLAKERGITVNDSDIKTELEKTIVQAGNREALEEIIKNLYNWDLKIFEQKVLYAYILEEKLAQLIQSDPEINLEAKQKIENLYKQISANTKDFYNLAKEYSEDVDTRRLGGDLNWIEKGQLDEVIENAAFGMETGQTSEILQTPAGYHIIKITDKKTTIEGVEQIRISHILIKTRSLDDWINEELKKCKIYRFI